MDSDLATVVIFTIIFCVFAAKKRVLVGLLLGLLAVAAFQLGLRPAI